MTRWTNSDGLTVKFGSDEADVAIGGQLPVTDGLYKSTIDINYTELLSATYAIAGSVANDGATGMQIPEGARIKGIEVIVLTAFTSSGTIATATLGVGLKKWSDFSTELDHDGFLTASFVGTNLDAVGERAYVTVGSTGAGALIGTTLAEDGVLVAANTLHASHPFTAGKVRIIVEYFYP
jgi:hypothetical protein